MLKQTNIEVVTVEMRLDNNEVVTVTMDNQEEFSIKNTSGSLDNVFITGEEITATYNCMLKLKELNGKTT